MERGAAVGISLLCSFAVAGGRTDLLITSDCGAVPNDGKDDGAAIQRCLDLAAAGSAGGQVIVYVPAGEFQTDQTLIMRSHNVTLEGTGDASIIASTSQLGDVIQISGSPSAHATHNMVVGLVLSRLVAPLAGSIGLRVEHADFTTVDRVAVYASRTGFQIGVVGGKDPLNDHYRTRISNSYALSARVPNAMDEAGVAFYSAADCVLETTFVEPGPNHWSCVC